MILLIQIHKEPMSATAQCEPPGYDCKRGAELRDALCYTRNKETFSSVIFASFVNTKCAGKMEETAKLSAVYRPVVVPLE